MINTSAVQDYSSEINKMTDVNIICGKRTSDTLKTIQETKSPFQSELNAIAIIKQLKPPTVGSPVQSKQYKYGDDEKENNDDLPVVRRVLRKSVSMNGDIISAADYMITYGKP